MLTQAAISEHSFGYDPIFFLQEYNYTVAELSTWVSSNLLSEKTAPIFLSTFIPLR